MPNLIKAVLLVSFIFVGPFAQAAITPGDPANFITTWDTTNPGASADNQITIPGTGSGYNYDLYWESLASSTVNGTSTVTTSSHTITFPEPGQYKVEINGDFPRIVFNNGGDRQKIMTVEQWGDIAWTSMGGAFYGATNLRVTAVDAPDLSNVTSMANMFRFANAFNDPVNHWIVTGIEDMVGIFYGATSFNQPLNSWNVSSATNMSTMFAQAISFNQPLDAWNTSSVYDMSGMFRESGFNQDVSTWNIENVTNMNIIFRGMNLSQTNIDNILTSWAGQNVQANVLFHPGVKTYSQVGADALDTLRSLGWEITEQYKATYSPGPNATLIGSGTQSPLNSGSSTTEVLIKPDRNCTFEGWSDGATDNPRTDTLVDDNLFVTASVHCPSTTSGGATASAIQAFKEQATTTTATVSTDLDATIQSITDTLSNLDVNELDQTKARRLIEVLSQLLTLLLQVLALKAA